MPLAYTLLFLGLASIFVEFFLPGGIFAAIGVILLLGGLGFSIMADPSLIATFSYFATLLLGVYTTVKFALYCVEHLFSKNTVFLKSDQEGYTAASWDRSLVGKEGTASTDLRPGGYIRINQKTYSAISKSGYLYKGDKILVIDGEGETLYVIEKSSNRAQKDI